MNVPVLALSVLEPTSSTADQVQRIVADSTRYNIGAVQRTVNVPVMPLLFLDPQRQARFKFARTTNTGLSMAFERPSNTAWAIQYQEADAQTIIRGTNEHDLPARGRFWIEPGNFRRFTVTLDEKLAPVVKR